MTLSIRSTILLEALLMICTGACASSGATHESDDRTRVADVNQTVVDVNLHHVESTSAKDPMASAPPVRCTSTGRFERELARLASAPG